VATDFARFSGVSATPIDLSDPVSSMGYAIDPNLHRRELDGHRFGNDADYALGAIIPGRGLMPANVYDRSATLSLRYRYDGARH
jgi:hypothetical protein